MENLPKPDLRAALAPEIGAEALPQVVAGGTVREATRSDSWGSNPDGGKGVTLKNRLNALEQQP